MEPRADAVLDSMVAAAIDWLEEECGRTIKAKTVTILLDGDDALPYGSQYESLMIPETYRPVAYPTGFSVKEDGATLLIGSGYDPSKDVLVRDGNSEKRRAMLLRSSWSPGAQNVEVTFTAGYADGSCPSRILQIIREVAWMFYSSPAWLGKSHQTGSNGGVTFEKELTPMTKAAIQSLREGIE
jgi:hypothetical protein